MVNLDLQFFGGRGSSGSTGSRNTGTETKGTEAATPESKVSDEQLTRMLRGIGRKGTMIGSSGNTTWVITTIPLGGGAYQVMPFETGESMSGGRVLYSEGDTIDYLRKAGAADIDWDFKDKHLTNRQLDTFFNKPYKK